MPLSACLSLNKAESPRLTSAASEALLAPLVQYGGSAGLGSGGVHTVSAGETLWSIAKRYRLSVEEIARANNLSAPYALGAGARLQLPPPHTYRVKAGDSVGLVARMFSVSEHELVTLNALSAPYRLPVGSELRLPRPGSEPSLREARANVAALPVLAPPPVTVQGLAPVAANAPPVSTTPGVLGTLTIARQPALPRGTATPNPALAVAQRVLSQGDVVAPDEGMPVAMSGGPAGYDLRPPVPLAKPLVQEVVARGEIPLPPPRTGRTFLQPVVGRVISPYGAKDGGLYNDGINIAAARGTPVRAAENGTVVYVGRAVEGYGNLVLIKHADDFVTAYAHLDKSLVAQGQGVRRGQSIGTVGSTGNVDRAQLHFEIRKGRRAVNPQSVI